MNMFHRLCCSSTLWARSVERTLLPWALSDVDLGDDALEIGPGYGANLRVLAGMTPRLTCVEIDPPLADRLSQRYGSRATIVTGDGTATGLPEARFSSVVCFTMLHHVPTQSLQDRLFTEAFRVLERGGTFAGSDGIDSLAFRLVHVGDTYNPIGPDTLPNRLRAAGFADVTVDTRGGQQRWRAIKA